MDGDGCARGGALDAAGQLASREGERVGRLFSVEASADRASLGAGCRRGAVELQPVALARDDAHLGSDRTTLRIGRPLRPR